MKRFIQFFAAPVAICLAGFTPVFSEPDLSTTLQAGFEQQLIQRIQSSPDIFSSNPFVQAGSFDWKKSPPNALLLSIRQHWPVLSSDTKQFFHPFYQPHVRNLRRHEFPTLIVHGNLPAHRIASLAHHAEALRKDLSALLPARAAKTEIWLVDSELPFPGYAIPFESKGEAKEIIFLNSRLDESRLLSELRFLMPYARAFSYGLDASPALYEQFAVWAAHSLGDRYTSRRVAAPSPRQWERGVLALGPEFTVDPSFFFYLSETFPTLALGEVWEYLRHSPPEQTTEDSISNFLSDRTGFSLIEILPRFSLWNLSRGRYSSDRYFHAGTRWPEIPAGPESGTDPLHVSESNFLLSPGAIRYYRLRTRESAMELVVDTHPDTRWSVQAAIYARGTAQWVDIPARSGTGLHSLTFPLEHGAEVWVSLCLLDNPSHQVPYYSLHAGTPPQPPFKLGRTAVSSVQNGRSVNLEWQSLQENGMFAWDIYRSDGRGHESRLTSLPIPGPGTSDRPFHYLFVDTSPLKGRQSYYVEGITSEGIRSRRYLGSVNLPNPRLSHRLRFSKSFR